MPFLNHRNFRNLSDLVDFPYGIYLDRETREFRRRLIHKRLMDKGLCVLHREKWGPEHWTSGPKTSVAYKQQQIGKEICGVCPVLKNCRAYADDIQSDANETSLRVAIFAGEIIRPAWESAANRRRARSRRNRDNVQL